MEDEIMLVLSRKIGEQICIGSGITLTVLEIQGQRVKIGIDAPRDCRVLRGELDQRADKPAFKEHVRQATAWLPCENDSLELATSH
jgi:carbon storage regulator CsrA